MPKLPVYENQVFPSAGSTAERAAATQRNAYNLGQTIEGGWKDLGRGVSKAIGDYEQRQKEAQALAEQEDVANLTVAYALQNAKFTIGWKKALSEADPTDSGFQQKYMEDAAPAYDAIHAGAKTPAGRRYSLKARADAYASQWVSTAADQANLNADAAVAQFEVVSNSYSTSAFEDPGNWKAYKEQQDAAMDAQIEIGNMNSKDAIKLRTDASKTLVQSAIKGMIRNNPQAALDAIKAGEFVGELDGEELFALENMALERIRSREADTKAAKVEERRLAEEVADKEAVELVTGIKRDKNGRAIVPGTFNTDVDEWALRNPGAINAAEVIALKNYANAEVARSDENVPVNQQVYEDFMARGMAGTLTRTDVLNARGNDKLTKEHFDFFYKWVNVDAGESKEIARFANSIERYKGFIIKSALGLKDTIGQQLWIDFATDMQERLPELKAAGMNQSQIDAYVAENVAKYELEAGGIAKAFEAMGERGRGMSPPIARDVEPLPIIKPKSVPLKDILGEKPLTNKVVGAHDVELKYTNVSAVRNKPLVPELEMKLKDAVGQVFGEGYSVEVFSGGQPPKDYPFAGKRTGSTRHDLGEAGDVYIIDPNGNRVTDEKKLDKLKDFWLSQGYGSVGTYMAGKGMHLDIKTKDKLGRGQALSWTY